MRRVRIVAAVLAGLLALVGAGCSSHLSVSELEASNRSAAFDLVRSDPAAAPGAPNEVPRTGAGDAAANDGGSAGLASPTADTGPAGAAGAGSPSPSTGGSVRNAAPGAVPAARPAGHAAAPTQGTTRKAPAGPGGSPGQTPAPGVAPPAGVAGGEVVFGSVGTSSGPIGANVASIPVAVRAWAATINARGGLGGHPVKVVFGDDGGDPGKAVSLARRMVEQDHIAAFVGLYGPTTIQAIIPYATDRSVPIVGGPSASVEEDSSPIVFNPQAGNRAAGQAVITTIVSQTPIKKVSIFYCREVQSCSTNRAAAVEYANKHGVQMVHEAQVSLAQPDFTAETVSARRAGAEAVVALVDLQSMIRIVRSAARQGWQPVFGGTFAFDTVDAEQASDLLDGLLATSLTVNFSSSPKMADYRDAVARYVPGGKLGGQGANAWAQGKLIEAAARSITGPFTGQGLLDGLHGLTGETLGGIVPPRSFPKGQNHFNPCVVPIKLAGGHWTEPLGETFVCD